jgi:phosphoenolpyruvate-protein phosphotransferase (PTS system enzyme I)
MQWGLWTRYARWSRTNSMKNKVKSSINSSSRQRSFEGQPVGAGIAIGVVHRYDSRAIVRVRERRIPKTKIRTEQHRLLEAAAKAAERVSELQGQALRMDNAAGEELGYILDAYQQMLSGSRLIRGVQKRIAAERVNAEAAVVKEISLMAEAFAAMDDQYLSERVSDIREIGRRLVESLGQAAPTGIDDLPRNAVVIADELSPADTALLDPSRIAGLATTLGGAESHMAIVARSFGLPAVIAVPGLIDDVRNGEAVVLDGSTGKVFVSPSAATLRSYRQKRAGFLRAQRSLKKLQSIAATTKDGFRIHLLANVELPSELDAVLGSGAEGIGLFRSEFMFMNRETLPTEDEQAAALSQVVKKMSGQPVTIRTLDVGADKLGKAVGIKPGPNPALGLRAIRFSLARRSVLTTQLAAILRAGAIGPVRILLPMVCIADEIKEVRRTLTRVARRLKKRGIRIADPLPPVGVMIEIPGAALAADALAIESDFFAIGTNDLTQYTLAIDRSDEQVAYLYNPLHPAVLRLIQFSAEAASAAGIPVSICGEMAGDERLTPVLLGFGITELSMAPANLPRVKKAILNLNLSAITGRVRRLTNESDPARLQVLLDYISQPR